MANKKSKLISSILGLGAAISLVIANVVLSGGNLVISSGGTAEQYADYSCSGKQTSIVVNASYVVLHDCVVDGSNSHGIRIGGEGQSIHHIVIERNTVQYSIKENGTYPSCGSNSWGSGIKVAVGATDVIIRDNIVHDTCGEGIAVTRSSNILIQNNVVYNNWAGNIYTDASANVTIVDNLVSCGANQIGSRLQFGIMNGHEYYAGWTGSRDNNKILSNTISSCSDGINIFKQEAGTVNYAYSNALIDGNTVTGSGRYSIHFSSGVTNQNVVVSNNRIFKAVSGALNGVVLSNNTIYNGSVSTPTPATSTSTATVTKTGTVSPTPSPSRTPTATLTPIPTSTPLGLYQCLFNSSGFECLLVP